MIPFARPASRRFRPRVFGAGLVAFAIGIASCGGSTPAPIPEIASVEAMRVVVDGVALNRSIVTVRFDTKLVFVEQRLKLESLFELAVPDPDDLESDDPVRVLVEKAEWSEGSRVVKLEVAQLVPAESTVKVARKAFRKGETGVVEAEVEADLNRFQVALASTAFGVADPAILNRSKSLPVTASDRDPDAMRDALIDHLSRRAEPDEVIALALQRYAAISAATVPSPKLRAALAALTGTFGDPALEAYFTPNNCTEQEVALIAFQPPPDFPNLFARVTYSASGARIVSISPSLEGERIEKLMPILVHEAIHCDAEDPLFEEVAATAIDVFFYLHLIPVAPEMVLDGTPLTREYNVDVVAFINSGRRLPESGGILPSAIIQQALPGTTSTASSFADLVAAAYEDSSRQQPPDEYAAQRYIELIAAVAEMPVKSAFDLVYLDELLGRALDPRLLLFAVQALGLEPAG